MSREFDKTDEIMNALFENVIKYRKLETNQNLTEALNEQELHKLENKLYAKYKLFILKLCREFTFGETKKYFIKRIKIYKKIIKVIRTYQEAEK